MCEYQMLLVLEIILWCPILKILVLCKVKFHPCNNHKSTSHHFLKNVNQGSINHALIRITLMKTLKTKVAMRMKYRSRRKNQRLQTPLNCLNLKWKICSKRKQISYLVIQEKMCMILSQISDLSISMKCFQIWQNQKM